MCFFIVEPDLRHDGRDAAADLFDLPGGWLDGVALLRYGTVDRRDRLHRRIKRWHHFSGFEDRFPGGLDTKTSADGYSGRRSCFCRRSRSNSFEDDDWGTVYVPVTDPSVAAAANFKVDPTQ